MPILAVFVAYLWFISAGKWISWPKTSVYDYYSSLAEAFQQGHLYLPDEPAPELMALPDPYRIGARKGIPHIWDASLYGGRYYLYWGPAPALLLIPVQAIFGVGHVADLYLVFAFICGLCAVVCAFMIRAWRRHFFSLPPWTLALGLMLGGFAPPLTWMLNRPEVYEAAIAAGQFFLLLGLYLCYCSLGSRSPSLWQLALASASWGMAIGSRNSQAIAVAFLLLGVAGISIALCIRRRMRAQLAAVLAALIVPVGICVLALLWYNWARFGAPLEFGYRYQLTLLQMPKHYGDLFSAAYVVPNVRNYFLNPFTIGERFPFLAPQYGSEFAASSDVPAIYFAEAVTGLIYTFPFMLLALLPWKEGERPTAASSEHEEAEPLNASLTWLRLSLAGVFLLELGTLLFFFFAAERYLADVVPSLVLLSVLGFWKMQAVPGLGTKTRAVLIAVGLLLAAVSILTSSLLAVSGAQDRILRMNPVLIQQINEFLGH